MKLSELMATHTSTESIRLSASATTILFSRSIAPRTAPLRLRTTRSRSLA